jgi:hypothetical protein
MMLDLNGYVSDVAKDGASPQTIRAYTRAIQRTGKQEVDTDRLSELYQSLLKMLDSGISYVYITSQYIYRIRMTECNTMLPGYSRIRSSL